MKKALTVLAVFTLVSLTLHGGTITGTVQARPNPAAEETAGGGKYASRRFKFVERVNYEEMRDFVVYIEGPISTTPPANSKPMQVVMKREITQKDAMFSPHVLPIRVGTTVEWPNMDLIFHNVFSISENKEFDLGLYKKPDVRTVTFDRPGRVDVFCSIHSSMNCIILVLENPYFAAVDGKGKYTIRNVPAGTYRLKAWHERLPAQRKEIVVTENGELRVNFTLGLGRMTTP